ncbi:MAG: hypothetical protein NTX17_10600 [Candidatus Eisenbacteria bacterium]|nr:hypothetical protein [Candidatus Eisenbacteria bacterium]
MLGTRSQISTLLVTMCLCAGLICTNSEAQVPSTRAVVEYMGHVQGVGDVSWVTQPGTCGTVGQGKRLEGFAIRHTVWSKDQVGLRYKAHLQDLSDTSWFYMPDYCGTRGEKRRMEAIWIEVIEKPDRYSVYYRAHLAGTGWTVWYRDGDMCGTRGKQRQIEAIEVMIVDR